MEYVRIYYDRIVRETDKAICVDIDNSKVWLQKSQIGDESNQIDLPLDEPEHPETPFFNVPEWLAIEKGLI